MADLYRWKHANPSDRGVYWLRRWWERHAHFVVATPWLVDPISVQRDAHRRNMWMSAYRLCRRVYWTCYQGSDHACEREPQSMDIGNMPRAEGRMPIPMLVIRNCSRVWCVSQIARQLRESRRYLLLVRELVLI